jgi:hypothetical protein
MTENLYQTESDQVACARRYCRDGRYPAGRYRRKAGGQDCQDAFGNKFIHEQRQTRELLIRRAPVSFEPAL